ncbi:ABC transporter permease [Evansella clarkii]|uniref:ABC transporter permease n=1 Tax=Evansella clarkii TaxID=79879 RepID=UPI000997555B|nr:ABC transporter permease [Evansella clarkii]
MINYLKSENYRLLHKKSIYMTSGICLFLITSAALVLYFFQQSDSNFPYGTSIFLYSNVISSGIIIMIVGFLFNTALTGKDASVMKQAVSFGISRNTIFWSKLIVTLSYFLLLCLIGLILVIGLGESLFVSEEASIRNFVAASFNMLPIALGGFVMIHALKMLKVSDIYIIIFLFFLLIFSGDLLRWLLGSFSQLNEFYQYAPSTLLNDNLMSFMDQSAQFDFRFWVTGIVISLVFLAIGMMRFTNKNID